MIFSTFLPLGTYEARTWIADATVQSASHYTMSTHTSSLTNIHKNNKPLNTDNNKFPKKMIAIRIIFSAFCQNGIPVLHYGIWVFHYGSWVLHFGNRDRIFFILGSEFCIMGSEFCILGSEFVFLCYERVNKSRDQWIPLIEDASTLSTD